jgi:formylglycine-generating enzyme required for sulfatase activity
MAFDLDTWKSQLAERLKDWKPRMQRAGVSSIYAFLSAAALWPVVEAYQRGEIAALLALGGVLGGVGGNLVANQIQAWKDRHASEAEAARQLEEQVLTEENLRLALDALLDKLEALPAAGRGLSESDRRWLEDVLAEELARLGSDLQVTLTGGGAIALGTGSLAAGDRAVVVKGNVGGDFLGPHARLEKHYHTSGGTDPAALRRAYLNRLLESASQLSLSGVDPKVASEAEAWLSLAAVYTALYVHSFDEQIPGQISYKDELNLLLREGIKDKDYIKIARKMRASRLQVETQTLSSQRIPVLVALNRSNRLVLLGDPGSGKTTFVNFVTLCLAGEGLGRADANLALLSAPLFQGKEVQIHDKEETSEMQSWDHNALLPVRVILRDFAARGLPEAGRPSSAVHLWQFIDANLQSASLGDFSSHLRNELLEVGGLLLLDGLDEVPEAGQRRMQIKTAIEDFAASFPNVRLLVTSRTYAYQRQDWRLQNFTQAVLAPFSTDQIRQFVERWYAHIAVLRSLNPEDTRGRAELLKEAIFRSDRLQGLAERPLLLTLMASLHAWRGGSLPEKREELYNDTVELLLDWWESPKVVRDAKGNVLISQPSLAEWLKVDRQQVRGLLNELAFRAHAAQPELTGTADISEGELVSGLLRLSRNPEASANPALLVDYLSQRAGLLLPHGVGVYTFPHRTFQEYLAACYLTDHDYPDKIAELACQDINRWREVALLAGAKAARGTASAIWTLAEALCYTEPNEGKNEKSKQWGAQLAGLALVESAGLGIVSARNQPKVERVKRWLVYILKTNDLPVPERARAGDTLAYLGDPRFDPDAWCLPAEPQLGFVEVPAGLFWMGSDEKQDSKAAEDERPKHQLVLPDYYIGRFPVTVAQFHIFVNEKRWGFEFWHLNPVSNHPVLAVTWYEAVGYCKWLEEKLVQKAQQIGEWDKLDETAQHFWRGLAEGKLWVTLPSEPEWEKAARGIDGRIYPWGDKFVSDNANNHETEIGGNSAVGCFPGGASPYGIHDLCGNVWEWTRSLYAKYPYPERGTERSWYEDFEAPGTAARVFRGGASVAGGIARCASRGWSSPLHRLRNFGFRVVVSPLPLDSRRSGSLGP